MLEDLSDRILEYLDTVQDLAVDTLTLSRKWSVDHQKVIGALKSLQAYDSDLLKCEPVVRKQIELTAEGKSVAENGSHEAIVYNSIPLDGIVQSELMKCSPNAKVGFSKAMSQGWIWVDKSTSPPMVRRKVDTIVDAVKENLVSLNKNELNNDQTIEASLLNEYKKRKLIQEITIKSFLIGKGTGFTRNLLKLETDLTVDMLSTGLWKQLKFKAYNFDALGAPPERGNLHPLLKVRSEFRQIFLEMGFSEMPTNNYVESSFWNFDALFQPQQHPARDAHDTFFISKPANSYKFPCEYLERVKKVHSVGGYGSQGYGYDWKIQEAQKNLLRTHTTAVSARMLYKLANRGDCSFQPVKYFSIDKVFRNETLDATHLAEFHQVEGVIADIGLTLGDLIGTLYEFFQKLGITQLEFKPAYNPYTEPSMEIFCFHPGLKKWIEVGNSGIFRPEMLLPMNLPESVNVIAWGLSLERPTMIKYGINNIRDLVGPKVDLKMVEENPLCRLDKN